MRRSRALCSHAAARAHLFDVKAEDIGIPAPPDGPDVWGVVIDYPTPATTATLVNIADGTVNLLLSEGPAFVGAGQLPEVARAAAALLSSAQSLHSDLKPTTDFSLPRNDRPRIYLLTTAGVLGGEVSNGPSNELLGMDGKAPSLTDNVSLKFVKAKKRCNRAQGM